MNVQDDPGPAARNEKDSRSTQYKEEYDDRSSVRHEGYDRHKSSRHDTACDALYEDSVTSSERERRMSKDELSRNGRIHYTERHGHGRHSTENHHADVGRHLSRVTDEPRHHREEYVPRHHRQRNESVEDRDQRSSHTSRQRSHVSEFRGLRSYEEDIDTSNGIQGRKYDTENAAESRRREPQEHSSRSGDAKETLNVVSVQKEDYRKTGHGSDRHERHHSHLHHSHASHSSIVSEERHPSFAEGSIADVESPSTRSRSQDKAYNIADRQHQSRESHAPSERSAREHHRRGRSSSRDSSSSSDLDSDGDSKRHHSSSRHRSRHSHSHSHRRSRSRSSDRSRSKSKERRGKDEKDKDGKKRKRRRRSESKEKKKRRKDGDREKGRDKSRKRDHDSKGRKEEERRSVLTGKKIKLKIKQDKDDIEREKNRKDLLMFLNSAMG